jgi:hypothetical protein
MIRYRRAKETAEGLLDTGRYERAVAVHTIFDTFYPEVVEAWADVVVHAAKVGKRAARPSLASEIESLLVVLKKLYFGSTDQERCPSWLLRGSEQFVHGILVRVLDGVKTESKDVIDRVLDYILALVEGFAETAPGFVENSGPAHALCVNLEANRESLLYQAYTTRFTASQAALVERFALMVLAEPSRDAETWSSAFGRAVGSLGLSTMITRVAEVGGVHSIALRAAFEDAKRAPAAKRHKPALGCWNDPHAIFATGASLLRVDDLFYPTGRLAKGGLIPRSRVEQSPDLILAVQPQSRSKSNAAASNGECRYAVLDALPLEIVDLVCDYAVAGGCPDSLRALRQTCSAFKNATDGALMKSMHTSLATPFPPPPNHPDRMLRTRLELFLNGRYKGRRGLLNSPLSEDKWVRINQIRMLLDWTMRPPLSGGVPRSVVLLDFPRIRSTSVPAEIAGGEGGRRIPQNVLRSIGFVANGGVRGGAEQVGAEMDALVKLNSLVT